jgi:hypothetical protein
MAPVTVDPGSDSRGTPPADRPDNGFVSAWSSSLVNGRPRLRFPRQGLRGFTVLTGSAAVVVALAVGAAALPKSMPNVGFVPGHDDPKVVAAAATIAPTPVVTGSPTANSGPKKKKKKKDGEQPAGSTLPTGSSTLTPAATATKKPKPKTTPTEAVKNGIKIGQLAGKDLAANKVVAIAAANGSYVITDSAQTDDALHNMLRSTGTATTAGHYILTWHNDIKAWTIKGQVTGLYVAAEIDDSGSDNGMLRARSTTVDAWEQFDIYHFSDGTYAFRSKTSGSYVSAEIDDTDDRAGMLRARAGTVEGWERFTLS